MVVFIDAFKLLLDGQTLVARLEDHLGLSGKHPAYGNVETREEEEPSQAAVLEGG